MAYKRKYKKGKPITSIDEMVKQDFVFVYDKITPAGWAMSWQLRAVDSYIKRGCIYYAEKIDESEG